MLQGPIGPAHFVSPSNPQEAAFAALERAFAMRGKAQIGGLVTAFVAIARVVGTTTFGMALMGTTDRILDS